VASLKTKLRTAGFSSITIALIYLATNAATIALAFGALVAGITFVTLRSKSSHNESALIAAWPQGFDRN